jgi:hypothetical protein
MKRDTAPTRYEAMSDEESNSLLDDAFSDTADPYFNPEDPSGEG